MVKDESVEGVTRAKFDNPLSSRGAHMEVEVVRLQVEVERVANRPRKETYTVDTDVFRIGSQASNDLVLDDPTVSRFHCRVTREGIHFRITDTESLNGTRMNGVRVLAADLEGEAVLVLGDSTIRLRSLRAGHVSVPPPRPFGSIVGSSAVMQRLFDLLDRVAASEIDVLIHGESGTGKELVATELVQRSARAEGPVIVVDCGAVSPSLVESELFGHVRGAFTGADRDREGAFEAADGGTLFLDEIGELPLDLQPKLLRALEAREVRRVGQTKLRRIDVRVIAATNRDLEREVNRGRFREDLYYRLAKVSVRVPPLRDRIEDVPLLVRGFLSLLGPKEKDAERFFTTAVMQEMQRYDWPGNVRELRNYVERSVVLEGAPPPKRGTGTSGTSSASNDEAPDSLSGVASDRGSESLEKGVAFRVAKEEAVGAFERAYLGPLLERCGGNVSKAAREARMDRMYLHQLAHKYGFRTTRKD